MATGWALIQFRQAGRLNVKEDLANHEQRIKELRELKRSLAAWTPKAGKWPNGASISEIYELKEKVFGERSPKYGAVVEVDAPVLKDVFNFFEANFSHVDGYTG